MPESAFWEAKKVLKQVVYTVGEGAGRSAFIEFPVLVRDHDFLQAPFWAVMCN